MHGTTICDALRHRRLLRFWYKDHSSPTTVEPYTYGQNKAGHMALSAWLVSGTTHDLKPPFWRLYLDSDMTRLEVLQEGFKENRRGYKPDDSRFTLIQCRVTPPEIASR